MHDAGLPQALQRGSQDWLHAARQNHVLHVRQERDRGREGEESSGLRPVRRGGHIRLQREVVGVGRSGDRGAEDCGVLGDQGSDGAPRRHVAQLRHLAGADQREGKGQGHHLPEVAAGDRRRRHHRRPGAGRRRRDRRQRNGQRREGGERRQATRGDDGAGDGGGGGRHEDSRLQARRRSDQAHHALRPPFPPLSAFPPVRPHSSRHIG
mmetsp:Transcript_74950/g.199014  ORF Transcript_74950/g.199014 Transcript_74950/m.199014 type:complete len:209 (+) Transcript_74950:429-1055(+)